MKNKRTIVIKNPQLKKIRNNLRSLILKSSRSIQHKIHDELEKIKNPDYYKYHPPDLRKRVKQLNDQYWAIERPLRASILLCPVCFQTDKDMTYNPVRKTWYCTECYEKLKSANINRGTPEEFP